MKIKHPVSLVAGIILTFMAGIIAVFQNKLEIYNPYIGVMGMQIICTGLICIVVSYEVSK